MMIGSDRPTEVPGAVGDTSLDHLEEYAEFTGSAEDIAGTPTSRIVGLGFIGAAVRRRTRLWVLLGVLGLAIGSALFVKSHPQYQVTATMLMVNDPAIDQPTAMQTDALLADNPAFAKQVLDKLGLNETVNTFLQTYTVTNVSNQLLSITVNAPTAAVATQRADFLASGYLTFRAGILQQQLDQIKAASSQQVTQAQDALNAVNNQLTQVSAESSSPAQQADLKSLRNKSTLASDYLVSVQQAAGANDATKQVTVTSMVSGSRVIQSTVPVFAHSRAKTALEYVVGGAFAGAVIGIGIIAVASVMSSRLRRRDDMAAALGAPVRLSVAAAAEGGRFSRRTRSKRDMRRVVTYLRDRLLESQQETPALAVVAVDNQKFVAALVMRTVVACVDDGKRVMVADLAGGALARRLGAKGPGIHAVAKGGGHIVVVVPDPEDMAPAGPLGGGTSSELADAFAKADALVTLAALDPAVAADYLGTWAADTVAVVTAGLSTAEKVQSAGEIIRGDSGIRTVTGVLLGADRSDESLGL
jgi:capsular polysaccharide biosynthesis protein